MEKNINNNQQINWFRQSAPYIHAHRGRTFVVFFGGEALQDNTFSNLVNDIALLESLGIRLVLVHGARPQIKQQLATLNIKSKFADNLRITLSTHLPAVEQAVGQAKMQIESHLSMGLPNTPMAGASIKVISGNFIVAQPHGVHKGIDFCQTGNVRKVDVVAITEQLKRDNMVLISPIGYSSTGEIFNLHAEDVATEIAIALKADKLIFIMEDNLVVNKKGELLRQLNLLQAESWLKNHSTKNNQKTQRHLSHAVKACRTGVRRAHFINRQTDGALLLELFTRDGTGTLITGENYEGLRTATINDIGGIMALISPLEEKGLLVKRSREQLELDLQHFTIIERDGMIIACAALFIFEAEKVAELACLAVHSHYQQQGRGDDLLQHIAWQAKKQHLQKLFTLTTQTMHWFIERGFNECSASSLPIEKKLLYNFQRQSKIFCKKI